MEKEVKTERLIALWALSESGLGGWMHALKIPFTGYFLGAFALLILTLLAKHNHNKWQVLLQATLLVMLVKLVASPHSPPTAYLAVGFQGLMGALVYQFWGVNKFASAFLGGITMLESALQKIITTTLIFGKSIWAAIDLTFIAIQKELGVAVLPHFSYWLIAAYGLVYVVWGLFVGVWSIGFSNKLQKKAQHVLDKSKQIIAPKTELDLSKKSLHPLWTVGIVLAVVAIAFLAASKLEAAKFVIMRTAIAIVLLVFVAKPLLQFFIQKILHSQRTKNNEQLAEILQMLPQMSSSIRPAMVLAAEEKKGIAKYLAFIENLVILSLFKDGEK